MRITKCDICKKTLVRNGDETIVSVGVFFKSFDICRDCAEPVLKFLKSKKLIEENKKRKSAK